MAEETKGVVVTHVFMGSTKIATISNDEVRYYFQDHLGSANVVTNSAGSMIELIEYKPFGEFSRRNLIGTSNAAWYYFTGKPLDDETGLMFYGARYYSPLLGRFITPDTIVQSPMNPQTLNRYSYCHNNPVNLIDPTGNFAWFIPAIIGAIKGAVIGASIGAATAAIMGGDIGRGALFGAIGGAAFAGFGSITQTAIRYATVPGGMGPMTAGATFAADLFGGIIGGAAGGAAGAAYLGADPLNGAGIGALSGGLFGQISRLPGTGWAGVGRVGLAGIAGGVVSEVGGGSFLNGFGFAGTVAGADFIYRSILSAYPEAKGIGSTMRTGEHPGAPKMIEENGIKKLVRVLNVDKPFRSNTGLASLEGKTGNFWSRHFWADETGPIMNFLAKHVPGINGMSFAHDISGHFLSTYLPGGGAVNSIFFNFQTMPIYYGINAAGSAINDFPALIGTYSIYGE